MLLFNKFDDKLKDAFEPQDCNLLENTDYELLDQQTKYFKESRGRLQLDERVQ